jgi:hypothetical protein
MVSFRGPGDLATLLHKLRDMRLEARVQTLRADIGGKLGDDRLATLTALPRGDSHGSASCVRHRSCRTATKVGAFYRGA